MSGLSVVIATRGRPADCDSAWRSVVVHLPDAELIVVEQIDAELGEYSVDGAFPGTWIRQSARGVSRARNCGLAAVTHENVLFLDDDAVLCTGVNELFARHVSSSAAVSGGCVRYVPSGTTTSVRGSEPMSPRRFGACFMEFATIWDTSMLRCVGGFDERFGVGSTFGAEEGAVAVSQIAARTERPMTFEQVVMCEHPDVDQPSNAKARSYGQGAGALLPLHPQLRFLWAYVVYTTLRTGLGTVVYVARGRLDLARPRAQRLVGVAQGAGSGLVHRLRGRP